MTFNTFFISTLFSRTIYVKPAVILLGQSFSIRFYHPLFLPSVHLLHFLFSAFPHCSSNHPSLFLPSVLPSFPLPYFQLFSPFLPSSLTWRKRSTFSLFSTWWTECYCAFCRCDSCKRGTGFTVLSGGTALASFPLLFTCVHWMFGGYGCRLVGWPELDLINHGCSCWGSSLPLSIFNTTLGGAIIPDPLWLLVLSCAQRCICVHCTHYKSVLILLWPLWNNCCFLR